MINIIQPPPVYTFSGNFIPIKLKPDSYVVTDAAASENLMVPDTSKAFKEDEQVIFRWGANEVRFTAKWLPNDFTKEFHAGPFTLEIIKEVQNCCNNSALLKRDFDFYFSYNTIGFVSKKRDYGYDMARIDGYPMYMNNVKPGRPAIYKENFGAVFELFLEDEGATTFTSIYKNRLIPRPGSDGLTSIDISDKLHNILQDAGPDLLNNGTKSAQCVKSCRRYYFTYAESYGDPIEDKASEKSPVYTILHGRFSYLGYLSNTLIGQLQPDPPVLSKNRFLKQGGTEWYTRPDQPQYLYWFNPNEVSGTHRLKTKFYFIDGTDETSVHVAISANQRRKYAFDVSFTKVFDPGTYPGKSLARYECWIENGLDQQVTEKLVYWLNYEHQQFARYFLYWSSFGSLDSMCCHGKGSSQFDLVQQEARRIRRPDYKASTGDSRMFDVYLTNGFKAVTGWLTRHQIALNRDFFLAAYKYRKYREFLMPIKISSTSIQEVEDGKNNIAQEFEYKYLFDEQAYTEGDVETNNLPVQDFIFGGFGRVRIVDQEGNLVAEVQAPGTFQVYRFDTIDGGDAFTDFKITVAKI